jgi:arylsulfatase A-like enzyme
VAMNRRDFLKIASLAALSTLAPNWSTSSPRRRASAGSPNVLIFLFDAMSARHLSFVGYPRHTTPKLDKFLEGATVYHNHQASAPYTTPATASLLTGTHALSHRAFQLGQQAEPFYTGANIFSSFDRLGYHTLAYTHNPMADVLLKQFRASLETYKPREDLFLTRSPLMARLAANDFNAALQANQRILDTEEGMTNSLLVSRLLASLRNVDTPRVAGYKAQFPIGLPGLQAKDVFFVLEDAIDWIGSALAAAPQPLLAYFHLLPPHSPYHPRDEFYGEFRLDGYKPPAKPEHLFTNNWTNKDLRELQTRYDEYFLYVDSEFERLLTQLEDTGLLEDSWIVFTSDHGELFERGIWGHTNLTLYHPVIHIPLLIKAPGQTQRQDIYAPTSAIDVLPTLQRLVGEAPADWVEGEVLPPYREAAYDAERPIFAFNPRLSERKELLNNGIFTLTKWPHKLIYYFGYEELQGQPLLELYNLEEDAEELVDLSTANSALTQQMLGELRAYIDSHDVPLEK